MGGLQRLFLKITPIVMLICFICFGITHAFQQQGQQNITYMSETYYDRSNFQPINNPTEEQKAESLKVYEFDTQSYLNGLNINIIKRAVNNTLDIETYTLTIEGFNTIWEDGYNFGDGVQTIINAVILVINTLIVPINIVITPLRIIAGILLTAFSAVGININRQTPIINMLNGILDYAAIPLIQPTWNADDPNGVKNTTWYMSEPLNYGSDWGPFTINVNFSSPSGGQYKQIIVSWTSGHANVQYVDTDDNTITVYQNDAWVYQDSRTIYIKPTNPFPDRSYAQLMLFLSSGTRIPNN